MTRKIGVIIFAIIFIVCIIAIASVPIVYSLFSQRPLSSNAKFRLSVFTLKMDASQAVVASGHYSDDGHLNLAVEAWEDAYKMCIVPDGYKETDDAKRQLSRLNIEVKRILLNARGPGLSDELKIKFMKRDLDYIEEIGNELTSLIERK